MRRSSIQQINTYRIYYLNNTSINTYTINTKPTIEHGIYIKPAQLTEYNLSIKTLGDNTNDVIKKIKCKQPTIYEESTKANTQFNDCVSYIPPLLSDEVIDKLSTENNTFFNTKFKEDTYNNKPLFYVNFSLAGTRMNNTIYVFGYTPGEFKYVIAKFGLYFCCNAKCFYEDIEHLTLQQMYTIVNL